MFVQTHFQRSRHLAAASANKSSNDNSSVCELASHKVKQQINPSRPISIRDRLPGNQSKSVATSSGQKEASTSRARSKVYESNNSLATRQRRGSTSTSRQRAPSASLTVASGRSSVPKRSKSASGDCGKSSWLPVSRSAREKNVLSPWAEVVSFVTGERVSGKRVADEKRSVSAGILNDGPSVRFGDEQSLVGASHKAAFNWRSRSDERETYLNASRRGRSHPCEEELVVPIRLRHMYRGSFGLAGQTDKQTEENVEDRASYWDKSCALCRSSSNLGEEFDQDTQLAESDWFESQIRSYPNWDPAEQNCSTQFCSLGGSQQYPHKANPLVSGCFPRMVANCNHLENYNASHRLLNCSTQVSDSLLNLNRDQSDTCTNEQSAKINFGQNYCCILGSHFESLTNFISSYFSSSKSKNKQASSEKGDGFHITEKLLSNYFDHLYVFTRINSRLFLLFFFDFFRHQLDCFHSIVKRVRWSRFSLSLGEEEQKMDTERLGRTNDRFGADYRDSLSCDYHSCINKTIGDCYQGPFCGCNKSTNQHVPLAAGPYASRFNYCGGLNLARDSCAHASTTDQFYCNDNQHTAVREENRHESSLRHHHIHRHNHQHQHQQFPIASLQTTIVNADPQASPTGHQNHQLKSGHSGLLRHAYSHSPTGNLSTRSPHVASQLHPMRHTIDGAPITTQSVYQPEMELPDALHPSARLGSRATSLIHAQPNREFCSLSSPTIVDDSAYAIYRTQCWQQQQQAYSMVGHQRAPGNQRGQFKRHDTTVVDARGSKREEFRDKASEFHSLDAGFPIRMQDNHFANQDQTRFAYHQHQHSHEHSRGSSINDTSKSKLFIANKFASIEETSNSVKNVSDSLLYSTSRRLALNRGSSSQTSSYIHQPRRQSSYRGKIDSGLQSEAIKRNEKVINDHKIAEKLSREEDQRRSKAINVAQSKQQHEAPSSSASGEGSTDNSRKMQSRSSSSRSDQGLNSSIRAPYNIITNHLLSAPLAKVSLGGARRRLGFKQKGLRSLNVHRSEEIYPEEWTMNMQRHCATANNSLNSSSTDEPKCESRWSSTRSYTSNNRQRHGYMTRTMEDEASANDQIKADRSDPKVCFVDGLGVGQIASRQALVSPYFGDVQLSISDQRGMLEVEIIRVRSLQSRAFAKRLPCK